MGCVRGVGRKRHADLVLIESRRDRSMTSECCHRRHRLVQLSPSLRPDQDGPARRKPHSPNIIQQCHQIHTIESGSSRVAAEAGVQQIPVVGSVVLVVMEPGLVDDRAGLGGQTRLDVCPLGGRCPADSLCLPVGLRTFRGRVAVLEVGPSAAGSSGVISRTLSANIARTQYRSRRRTGGLFPQCGDRRLAFVEWSSGHANREWSSTT